jgi:hypothetical protein
MAVLDTAIHAFLSSLPPKRHAGISAQAGIFF